MSFRITILGCGPSGGVPKIGPNWGKCDSSNPKNRRRRCSVLVDRFGKGGRTSVLVDTSPDIREQLIDARVAWIDGVLYTHDHADHTHGIDDLRMVSYAMKHRVDVYFDAATRDSLMSRFGYCFAPKPDSGYEAILKPHDIEAGGKVRIEGKGGPVEALCIEQKHGDIPSIGFRFGNFAYSPDVSDIPSHSAEMLEGLDVWIVDALRQRPHPNHFHVRRALDWIERLKPKRAILTHMTTDLDYDALKRALPDHVEPAYDGMVIEISE